MIGFGDWLAFRSPPSSGPRPWARTELGLHPKDMPESLADADGCAAPVPGVGVFDPRRPAPGVARPARVRPLAAMPPVPVPFRLGEQVKCNRKKERKSA